MVRMKKCKTAVSILSFFCLLCVYYHRFRSLTSLSLINYFDFPPEDKNSGKQVSEGKKLLTIFTVLKEAPGRNFIQKNTIINWASLDAAVQPILFANLSYHSELTSLATKEGWTVLPLQGTNSFGTPFLKSMYKKATSVSDSYFYGFCNGDILFDQSLLRTLKFILKEFENNSSTLLIIGRRTNVQVKDVYHKLATHDVDLLSGIAKSQGRLFRENAEDYFFLRRPARFPWHTIKEVVIGRPAYDNYLVGQALAGKVPVVDATLTLLALHQTGSDGILASFLNKDSSYNKRIIGSYQYHKGHTTRAQFQTVTDWKRHIVLLRKGTLSS